MAGHLGTKILFFLLLLLIIVFPDFNLSSEKKKKKKKIINTTKTTFPRLSSALSTGGEFRGHLLKEAHLNTLYEISVH